MSNFKSGLLTHGPFSLGLCFLALLLAGCVRRTPANGFSGPQALTPLPTLTRPAALAGTNTFPPVTATLIPDRLDLTTTVTSLGPSPTPDLETYNRQAWSETSPYGPWQAIFVIAYPEDSNGNQIGSQYYVKVKVTNLETGEIRPIVDEWRPYGLGFTIPQALLWSNDGRYLFLAETGNADGSRERFYDQLERVQLASGKLDPLDLPGGPSESISPDGRQLARIDGERLALIVIETGQQQELNFDVPRVEWRPAQIFWSPQSNAVLFSVRLNPFAPVDEMRSNLYLADVNSGEVKTLIADDRRRFAILSFPEETTALLADLEAREWWLSLPDGTVQPDPPEDIAQAIQAVQSYFKALQSGRYMEASQWYGGPYTALQDINPEADPNDGAALLSLACSINGYHCLTVDSLQLEHVTQSGKYLLEVSFVDADGNPFVLNPCCGADLETQPPTWLFQYSVERDANGRYKVMELPVYSP